MPRATTALTNKYYRYAIVIYVIYGPTASYGFVGKVHGLLMYG